MSRSIEGAKPSIVRVKRRRQDPAPLDLIIEAPRQAAQNADPADCFATLAVSTNHTHKRRKFQLVTTVSDKHQETEDLLQALQSGRATDKLENNQASNLTRTSAGYRQIPVSNAESNPVQQNYKIYDLVNTAADQPRADRQLFSGANEAHILKNYYPLVQQYLQQQQQQQQQHTELPPQESSQAATEELNDDEYVVDYYTLVQGEQSLTGAGSRSMPIIQVRDDELWWQESADASSDADESDDSNAEDWYGNDYPEGEESAGSECSEAGTDGQYSSDD